MDTIDLVVWCDRPECPAVGKEYRVQAIYAWSGAWCHHCGKEVEGYTGHDLGPEIRAEMKTLPEPVEWEAARLRAEALNRIVDRELGNRP